MKRFLGFAVVAVVVLFGLIALAGHKPVSCKGYMYWDIYESHQGGHRWRSVRNPVTFRSDPIAASIWQISEAASHSLLVMQAKAQQQAGTSKIKTRSWDAVCWQFGEAEPIRHSWPVQP
jgi:hypothetical protein